MGSWRQILFASLLIAGTQHPAVGQEWKLVKGTMLCGIGGLALISHAGKQTQYIAVHDAKKPGEPRLAIITDEPGKLPIYESIVWPDNNPPIDAEAISAIPGTENAFVVMASGGKLFHIIFDPLSKTVQVVHTFSLPEIDQGSNYEGLSFLRMNGEVLAVWAHRGQGSVPAKLFWSIFDPSNYTFSSIGSEMLMVPWPVEGVRHVADLKVGPLGILYIVASSDLGNNGPFESAFYVAGVFRAWNKKIFFSKNPVMYRIMQFYDHKIEAIEFVPGPGGGVIFGSDDENLGGSIYSTWQ
ncbi:hypothetical protein F9K33_05275 [bacterium]|nr:MAG: hypothetical protein F9K33_05275 [bacterium]